MKNSEYILQLLACAVFPALLPALQLVPPDFHPENILLSDGGSDLSGMSRDLSMLILLMFIYFLYGKLKMAFDLPNLKQDKYKINSGISEAGLHEKIKGSRVYRFTTDDFDGQPLNDPVLFRRDGKTFFRFQDRSEKIILIGFRFDNILAFCEGDPLCNRQLVHSFIATFDNNVKQFRICLQRKNEEAVVELSHKMLTLCRYLEALEILDIMTPLALKNSAFRGSRSFFLQGEQALEMIEALLNVIRENELKMYSA